jgi:2-(3-amino-3-carboxypropyl)histidine synthase
MDIQLKNLEERYNLQEDLIKLEKELKIIRPKSILLQLPDGLKPYSTEIVDKFKEICYRELKKDIPIIIWLGSCFGACDLPNSNADLLIQLGHAPWN